MLTKPNMKVPARGKAIYSINEANRWMWDPELTEYITAIQKGEGETKEQYSSRYIGSMVGDVHRTLLYGGLFGCAPRHAPSTRPPPNVLRLCAAARALALPKRP